MPIFTRRAIQLMLDELAPWLTRAKARDLVHRLDHREPDQAIPFEYELALQWAVSQVADLEVEKPVGSREPDFFSTDLLASGPAHVEIAAVSDVALSGEVVMKRAANIITDFAKAHLKGSGRHLHFEFQVESGYRPPAPSAQGFFSLSARSRYFRRRRITNGFALTEGLRTQLAEWLRGSSPRTPVRLTNDQIDVVIEWRDREVHPHGNVFSRMPSEAHDLRENPVWKVLKSKEREQLRAVPAGVKRVIFLCDAGCTLLRDVNPISPHHTTVSGRDVIRAFLSESTIDGVCVFTPGRSNRNPFQTWNNPLIWRLHVFDLRDGVTEAEYAKVVAAKNLLPPPIIEGYQARSWHQQAMFDPQGGGQYLPPQWRRDATGVETVRISARGLQEYLAGRLTREEFIGLVEGELFEQSLRAGKTISAVSLETTGVGEDDDYLVFEFAADPNASKFRIPEAAVVASEDESSKKGK